ncbi:hypothetical protein SO802_006511 [Lithocarpus litseifolius]|uniref:Plant bHLH transcription factor ACT-like domain-containing protein n=1 Tax=Lithocarpus litseifolius TaxID=425828 RepID=A0AAW2DL65_9ROSI
MASMLQKRIAMRRKIQVQKLREGFLVKVNCEKGEDRLVRILEAFDEMGLNVQQARVSSNKRFEMEAIVVAQDQALDVKEVTEALLGALKRKLEMRHYTQEASKIL